MRTALKAWYLLAAAGLGAGLLSGCANKGFAQFGSVVGRGLGRPVGALVVALEETVATAGEVARENPRRRGNDALSPATGFSGEEQPAAIREDEERRKRDEAQADPFWK